MMCGLFGMFTYGDPMSKRDTHRVIEALAIASAERGTHATGIAYLNRNRIGIIKAPKPAYNFKFNIPTGVKAVIGHTRLATQGHQKYNSNNHPFAGKTKKLRFALAHNGVLYNDVELRKKKGLPLTKNETDSYIAVQLLNREDTIDFSSVTKIAEEVEGSFVFTILENSGSLYIVKGNNPLTLVHCKSLKTYFYASTEDILLNGLSNSHMFNISRSQFNLTSNLFEKVNISTGSILRINTDGKLMFSQFKLQDSYKIVDIFAGRFKSNRFDEGNLTFQIDNE